MRVRQVKLRQVKTMADLGLTRPRFFRQWKLGSEPPQFGDLSVTEAQIYLATGSDVEAIFLDEERGDSPGFWAKTDPAYDPHRLVTSADALNRPYIGMQIAIPAQWVEVTVRYSKQTAQTLAKLGRTGRRGYRAVEEQIRSRRERRNPADPDIATSCGCGFSDHHHADHDWIELPRILTIDGVLHAERVWPVAACGQIGLNPHARTFPPRQVLETEKPWRYCPRCWPIAKRRLLDLSREQMMGEAHRSVASEAAENGASWGDHSGFRNWTPGDDIPLPDIPVARYPRQTVSFTTPTQTTVQPADDVYDASAGPDREDAVSFSTPHCPACKGRYDDPEVLCTYDISHSSWTCNRPLVAALLTGATINASDYSKIIITGVSTKLPVFLLTESKAHLPTILQQAGLTTSRARARAGINDGSVTIEGWPSIAHRHTFKSEDLNGKLLRIGGRPALRFTAQVGDDSPERTDS